MRFEVLLRDAQIEYFEACRCDPQREEALRDELERRRSQIRDDFAFVAQCNIGDKAMAEADIERLHRIGAGTWLRQLDDRLGLSPVEEARVAPFPSHSPCVERVLADKLEHRIARDDAETRFGSFDFAMRPTSLKQNLGELYNLSIVRGTLTDEDRYLINEHISSTIEMLETLPWPKEMQRVVEYAGGHHEKTDGTGYPRKLQGHELSIPARIMAIADIFEALTADDRPYKKAKTLSQAMQILQVMAREQHIDGELFKLFVNSKVYLEYAAHWLSPAQIDEVDEAGLLDAG